MGQILCFEVVGVSRSFIINLAQFTLVDDSGKANQEDVCARNRRNKIAEEGGGLFQTVSVCDLTQEQL